jgi:RNA polymerase sigma-70 factor (ECF subfamily)
MLMVRYQRGDREAFGCLVDRHVASVFTFTSRLLQDPSLAEQVTEQTFLTVVSRAAEFKHEARFRAWLFAIARALCVTRRDIPEAMRRSTPPAEQREGGEPDETDSAPGLPLLGPARRAAHALGDLPVDQREAWLLKEVARLPFAEIAVITEADPDIVRTRLGHALERIRHAVADSEEYARSLR